MHRCRKCGVILNNENWGASRRKYHNYICKKCNNEYMKKYLSDPEKRRKHMKRISRLWKKKKILIRKIFGNKCEICGEMYPLILHEIRGKKHTTSPYYVLNHRKDFVILCRPCHVGVHFCMRFFGMMWQEIKTFISHNSTNY